MDLRERLRMGLPLDYGSAGDQQNFDIKYGGGARDLPPGAIPPFAPENWRPGRADPSPAEIKTGNVHLWGDNPSGTEATLTDIRTRGGGYPMTQGMVDRQFQGLKDKHLQQKMAQNWKPGIPPSGDAYDRAAEELGYDMPFPGNASDRGNPVSDKEYADENARMEKEQASLTPYDKLNGFNRFLYNASSYYRKTMGEAEDRQMARETHKSSQDLAAVKKNYEENRPQNKFIATTGGVFNPETQEFLKAPQGLIKVGKAIYDSDNGKWLTPPDDEDKLSTGMMSWMVKQGTNPFGPEDGEAYTLVQQALGSQEGESRQKILMQLADNLRPHYQDALAEWSQAEFMKGNFDPELDAASRSAVLHEAIRRAGGEMAGAQAVGEGAGILSGQQRQPGAGQPQNSSGDEASFEAAMEELRQANPGVPDEELYDYLISRENAE